MTTEHPALSTAGGERLDCLHYPEGALKYRLHRTRTGESQYAKRCRTRRIGVFSTRYLFRAPDGEPPGRRNAHRAIYPPHPFFLPRIRFPGPRAYTDESDVP